MHRKLSPRQVLFGLVLGLLPAMAAPAPTPLGVPWRTIPRAGPTSWRRPARLSRDGTGCRSPPAASSAPSRSGRSIPRRVISSARATGATSGSAGARCYGDFLYHVEWRFTPVPGKKGYNSGVYARNSADGAIYHQAQTGDGSGGYLFGNTLVAGAPKRFNLAKQSGENRVKPAGEWNTYEITCRGKEMILRVNGGETSAWRDCEVPRGHVGLEAEGFRIEFRNLKVKPLGPAQ